MKSLKLKGAYASINLDNIVHNYREACRFVGKETTVTCVVKSDAYGHGEKQVVKALIENGIKMICVSTIIEAIRLRNSFKDVEILILGYTPIHLLQKVSDYNLIQTISSLKEAEVLNQYKNSRVHIKINTGMNRLGFSCDDIEAILAVSLMENIRICGIFSHMHSSDKSKKNSAELQFERFNVLIKSLKEKKVNLGIKHICNSGGIIDLKPMHLDMVREGIMLYGMYPSSDVDREHIKLKECMSFRSYIANIRQVDAGEGISYGHTFVADKKMTIATVNLGYSDGVFRNLSNKAEVIIKDERRKIVGTVCMNMFMVDVTDMENVAVEDEVIIFGKSENQFISIDEVAEIAGTISYEITCRTGYSIPRVYIKNNKIIEIENELLIEG